jgi:hypothetical protein
VRQLIANTSRLKEVAMWERTLRRYGGVLLALRSQEKEEHGRQTWNEQTTKRRRHMKSESVELERLLEMAELQDLAPSLTHYLVKARSAREARRIIQKEGGGSDAVVDTRRLFSFASSCLSNSNKPTSSIIIC